MEQNMLHNLMDAYTSKETLGRDVTVTCGDETFKCSKYLCRILIDVANVCDKYQINPIYFCTYLSSDLTEVDLQKELVNGSMAHDFLD